MPCMMKRFLGRGFVIAGLCAGLLFAATPVFASGDHKGGHDKDHSSDHKGDKDHDKGHKDDHEKKDHKGDGHGKKGSH
jgi:hypothetical protein